MSADDCPRCKEHPVDCQCQGFDYYVCSDIRKIQIRKIMKPAIGTIVLYNHPGSACGKYPPTQSPAIIQNVAEDGTCRLFVFGPKGQHMDDGIKEGHGPCQWSWPPRV